MVDLHLGFRTPTKAQLRGHIAHFDAIFNSFAGKMGEFCSLGAGDQGCINSSVEPSSVLKPSCINIS